MNGADWINEADTIHPFYPGKIFYFRHLFLNILFVSQYTVNLLYHQNFSLTLSTFFNTISTFFSASVDNGPSFG